MQARTLTPTQSNTRPCQHAITNTSLSFARVRGGTVQVLCKLNMGRCKLAVQAPIGTIKDVSELAGKRIVTSFPKLSKEFFAKYDKTGDDTDIK
jgi:ATP phosphoribosyltransferase